MLEQMIGVKLKTMTMKAAVLAESHKPLIVDEVQLPSHLEHGQVRVRVIYSGICGAQINEIDARKGPDQFLPHLLGHEGSAQVEACGPGVVKIKPGDYVVMHWRPGQGLQSPTPKYFWKGRTLNAGWVTTFNERAIVSENRVTAIPKGADLKTAALYGCALTTGYGVVHNDAHLQSGESLVVIGSGGAGISVILMASLAGVDPIVAVDIHDEKLVLAKKFGATHTINSKKEDIFKTVMRALPQGADVAVDATGIKEIRELCYELASAKGRTIFVGVPLKGEKISIDSFPLHFGKSITGSHGGNADPTDLIPKLMALQTSGRLRVDGMISHEFNLGQINRALDLMRAGKSLRCVIKVGEP